MNAGFSTYEDFAEALTSTRIISDPWVEGKERFRLDPMVLTEAQHRAFTEAIESIGRAYHEMTTMLSRDIDLVRTSFHLTPWQERMWIASAGIWHGIARADAFVLEDGTIRICELNADTPSGEPEAVLVNRLLRPDSPDVVDPNESFQHDFIQMVRRSFAAIGNDAGANHPVVAIIYPTDIPEDLSMIELYKQWFRDAGWDVELGSPYNLVRQTDGTLTLFGRPIDIVFRHYKTDWWSEREGVLIDDEIFLDPDPLDRPLQAILGADIDGNVAVVNPFGAMLVQNKLSLAFLHQEIDRFSPESRRAIRNFIPYSIRLSDCDLTQLAGERNRWVLKSDFGCEGDEVILGPLCTDDAWTEWLDRVKPDRWIAQEYFSAAALPDGSVPNYGLFLIGGKGGAIFTRLSGGLTDQRAVTAPTFVRRDEQPVSDNRTTTSNTHRTQSNDGQRETGRND
jgi:glutathionylspermidine synthase